VIVGASGKSLGSAYLFDANSGAQLFKLIASDAAEADAFGTSVAIDGNTAIVGARWDDDNGENSGSAYLFDVDTGEQLFKLTPNDGASLEWFGHSVAISGDIAIVGARDITKRGIFYYTADSAYLFDVNTGLQIAKLVPSLGSGAPNADAVDISGDTAVIGVPFHADSGAFNFGDAYLFDVATSSLHTGLSASDGDEYDFFGSAVGVSGNTAVVGAPGHDEYRGGAYLFDAITGSQIAKLMPSNADEVYVFGRSVDVSGTAVIVGATSDNEGASGSAYLFSIVPEPTTMHLGALAIVGLLTCRRRAR
jgi:hypothetical protein